VRVFPGPSRIRIPYVAAGISPGHQALPHARARDLPDDAAGLVRRGDRRGVDRAAGARPGGPARGDPLGLPDRPRGRHRASHLAADRDAPLSQLAEVHERGEGAVASVEPGEDSMSKSIVMATAATADLVPAPIPPGWILQGVPEATNAQPARNDDLYSYLVVRERTPGRFT